MPNYVTITPKYQVVDLADMLKVPEMLNKERQEQEDKYNENLDKLAAIEAIADESTRYRLQNYRNSLENAANTLIGRQGTLADAAAYMNQARQYYRDALPIIKAYETKQKEIDTRRQILANDPSARFTALPDLETYIKNPNQDWYHYSGDKVYDKAMKSAAVISKDKIIAKGLKGAGRAGFVKEINDIGYTPEEQVEYARLIGLYNRDHSDAEALKGLNDPKYKQLFEDYKGLLQDNLSHNYSTEDRDWGRQRILDGQLVGMQRQTTEAYHTDPLAIPKSPKSVKGGGGDDEQTTPIWGQYNPTDRYTDQGQIPITDRRFKSTFSINRKTGKIIDKEALKTLPPLMRKRLLQELQSGDYEDLGIFEASAIYYNRKPTQTISDTNLQTTISGIMQPLIATSSDVGQKTILKNTSPGRLQTVAKSVGFNTFNNFEDILNEKDQVTLQRFYNALARYGNVDVNKLLSVDANKTLAKLGFYKISNEMPDLPEISGIFSKKEMEKFKKAGVQFYNKDGSPRTNDEIAYDAFLLKGGQYENMLLSTVAGAGEEYTKSILNDIYGNFNFTGKRKVINQNGKSETITITPESIEKGLYKGFTVAIDPIEFTKPNPEKVITFTNDKDEILHLYVPMDKNEKLSAENAITQQKIALANGLYLKEEINANQANAILQMTNEEFIKGLLFGKLKVNNVFIPIEGYNINDVTNTVDDAILIDFEKNRLPKNSETDGKLFQR